MMKPTRVIFVIALAGISVIPSLAYSQQNHLNCTLSIGQIQGAKPESITFDTSARSVLMEQHGNSTQGENVTITNEQIKFETHGGTASGREQNGTDNIIDLTTGQWTLRDWAFDYAPSPVGNHWFVRTRTLTCKPTDQ